MQMRLFRNNGVTPLIVFDGDRLPAKAAEEEERRARRAERRAHAQELLARGDTAGADTAFQTCVDVTPAMAREVMDGLEAEDFDFVVAPYEADAQLAFLAATGAVDLVATEDSDLVAYGCRHLLFKLDKNGAAMELRLEDLGLLDVPPARAAPVPVTIAGEQQQQKEEEDDDSDALPPLRRRSGGGLRKKKGELSFRRMSTDAFLLMCILAGCDFLESLNNVGIKRAHALARRTGTLDRIITWLRVDATHLSEQQRSTYAAGLRRAWHTFRHARVYSPDTQQLVHLNPLPQELCGDDVNTDFLGPAMSQEVVVAIAQGRLCPLSRQPFAPRAVAGAVSGRPGPTGPSLRHAAPQLQEWPPPPPPAYQQQQHAQPVRRMGTAAGGWHMPPDMARDAGAGGRSSAPKPVNANIASFFNSFMASPRHAADAGEVQLESQEQAPAAAVAAAAQQTVIEPVAKEAAPPPLGSSNPFMRPRNAAPQRPAFPATDGEAGSQLFAAEQQLTATQASGAKQDAAGKVAPVADNFSVSRIGRMFNSALTAGAAWIPSPSKRLAPPPLQPPVTKRPSVAAVGTPAPAGARSILSLLSPMTGDGGPAKKQRTVLPHK